jgi:hypothetical protein
MKDRQHREAIQEIFFCSNSAKVHFNKKAPQKSSSKKIVLTRNIFVKETILPKSISTKRHSRKAIQGK